MAGKYLILPLNYPGHGLTRKDFGFYQRWRSIITVYIKLLKCIRFYLKRIDQNSWYLVAHILPIPIPAVAVDWTARLDAAFDRMEEYDMMISSIGMTKNITKYNISVIM